MSFDRDVQTLVGTPVVKSKYIYGSIFHLHFATSAGEGELICNGCQWIVLDREGTILLHDEASLSDQVFSGMFTGKKLRGVDVEPDLLTLRFEDVTVSAFVTEDYHLYVHDGVALGSPEWRQTSDAVRDSFMLIRPGLGVVGYEFVRYFDLNLASWGKRYLSEQGDGLG